MSAAATKVWKVLAGMILTTAAVGNAATIHVPADQVKIQAAIDAAVNGDTVLVAPGTYFENINFRGKAITLVSEQGPALTVIDGGSLDSVVALALSEGPGSVLSGFTVQNGFSTSRTAGFGDGGGIRIGNPFSTTPTSPTIQNNIIQNNRACDGVGIMVRSGSPLIQGNTIINNSQAGCSGGTGGGGIGIVGTSNAQILKQHRYR